MVWVECANAICTSCTSARGSAAPEPERPEVDPQDRGPVWRRRSQRAEHRAITAQGQHGVAPDGERRLRPAGDRVRQARLLLGSHQLHSRLSRPGDDLLKRVMQITLGPEDESDACDAGPPFAKAVLIGRCHRVPEATERPVDVIPCLHPSGPIDVFVDADILEVFNGGVYGAWRLTS
jgi:hypothetical protein